MLFVIIYNSFLLPFGKVIYYNNNLYYWNNNYSNIANQDYVDNKYNDIKNNEITYFKIVKTVDITYNYTSNNTLKTYNTKLFNNGYYPFILLFESYKNDFSVTKKVTKGENDYFYVLCTIGNDNAYNSKIIIRDINTVVTDNTNKNIIKNYFGYSMDLGNVYSDITELNNIKLECRWSSNVGGLEPPYGNVSGTITLTLSGIAVKVT